MKLVVFVIQSTITQIELLSSCAGYTNNQFHIQIFQLPRRNANILRKVYQLLMLKFHLLTIMTLSYKFRNILFHPINPINLLQVS